MNYVACVPFSSIYSVCIAHNQATINFKNLPKKHDQTFINLTNIFDHGLTTSLSMFIFLIYVFIRLNVSVYI